MADKGAAERQRQYLHLRPCLCRSTGGLPGGINPVTWMGTLRATASVPLTVQWLWAAAVYTKFSTNYNSLGVKATDDNHFPPYQNYDQAGTPENFKSFVTGGARGGGGSNFTGSLSATASVQCPVLRCQASHARNKEALPPGLTLGGKRHCSLERWNLVRLVALVVASQSRKALPSFCSEE